MVKVLAAVLLLLIGTVAVTDKETIQQTLNGAFEKNGLSDPTTIVVCIDDATAHKIVVFVGQLLSKAAAGSVHDIESLPQLIKNFGKQIPDSVSECLHDNAEFEALGKKYGIDSSTDPSVIEKKAIQYLLLHYLNVHKEFGKLNKEWKAGQSYQMGSDLAQFGHEVLGLTTEQII